MAWPNISPPWGAVQRMNHRDHMGAGISRIGQGWQPDLLPRRAFPAASADLGHAIWLRGVVAILNMDKPRAIPTVASHGHAYEPEYANTGSA
jgi:hypothetical protein